MSYLGDFDASDTIYFKFTTVDSAGASAALSGGTAAAYKDNSTTQTLTGVTLTASFDSLTGLNHITVDTSQDGSFYAVGSDFQVIMVSGTVGGSSIIGYVVGEFSLRNRANLYPTIAGRMLDVSAGGEAGLDWANIGSPTTTQNLSGTTIKDATDVETKLGTPAGASVSADILTIDNFVDDLESRIGTPSNFGSGATIAANLVDIEAQTDDIGTAGAGLTAIPWNASWDAEVQSEVQDALEANNLDHIAGTATGIPSIPAGTYIDQIMDDGTATYDRTTDSLQAIRDRGDSAWITSTLTAADVWNAATRTLTAFSFSVTVGTNNDKTGYTLSAAGIQAIWDALTSALTTAGSIGKLLVDNINATISSVKAKTDQLTFTTANRVDSTVVDKTGFKLASDGLDSISITAPSGVASNYREMMVQLWRRFFKKSTQTSTELKTYADNGTTVLTTQALTDDGTTQTQGTAT